MGLYSVKTTAATLAKVFPFHYAPATIGVLLLQPLKPLISPAPNLMKKPLLQPSAASSSSAPAQDRDLDQPSPQSIVEGVAATLHPSCPK